MLPPDSGSIMKKKKWTMVFPNIPSTVREVPHGNGITVPESPKDFTIDSDNEKEGKTLSDSPETQASTEPHVFHSRSFAPQ
jgi:hypothetical protein